MELRRTVKKMILSVLPLVVTGTKKNIDQVLDTGVINDITRLPSEVEVTLFPMIFPNICDVFSGTTH